jgi:hypothetical protein
MDKETTKEIEDLQNNLSALVSRKRKREDAALEEENKLLKRENTRLMVYNVNHANDNYQSNQKLAKLKQTIDELEIGNKRLKNEMEQQVLSDVFLQRSHDKEVAK